MLTVHASGGYTVPRGQDVMISVYNIHHSPAVWDDAEAFQPERFSLDTPTPNEQNTDYRSAIVAAQVQPLPAMLCVSKAEHAYVHDDTGCGKDLESICACA